MLDEFISPKKEDLDSQSA